MFTARRLGVTKKLTKNLTNTNCIESMISVARRTTGRVTGWKDGSMKKALGRRWDPRSRAVLPTDQEP
jgi:hypothetical protein